MFVIRTCTYTFSRFHSPSPSYSTLQITHYRNSFGWFGSQLSFKFNALVLTILFLSSYFPFLFLLRSNLLSYFSLRLTYRFYSIDFMFHLYLPPPHPPCILS